MTTRTPTLVIVQIAAGTIITLGTIAAWLWGKLRGIDTGELMAFVVPIVGALFLVTAVGRAGEAAQQAAQQTNGMLEGRIKAAVASALADRDAARTRQAVGDVSEDGPA